MSFAIDSDFPGGNIIVDRIDGDTVSLHQDLRDTAGDWFYWCFRIVGAGGRTLRFTFTGSRVFAARGPAISSDQGRTWSWLGKASVEPSGYSEFSYSFAPGADDMRFSFGMPYLQEHWERFMAALGPNALLSAGTLCKSNGGRDVELLLLGNSATATHCVALTARHHCCEMIASYVIEGMVRWILNDQNDNAEWLRQNVAFFIVPFVDKDGVENGDQGKSRKPWDHGRDYREDSIYATTTAIREQLPKWTGNRLRAAVDLHCPHIAGSNHECIYLVGRQDPDIAREQVRFSRLLEKTSRGPLPFSAEDYLPFGKDWNVAADSGNGVGFSRWAATLPGMQLAAPIEMPYANVKGVAVGADNAREFGRDLAATLATYLMESTTG